MFGVNQLELVCANELGWYAKPDSSEFEKANMEEALLFWSFGYMENNIKVVVWELQFEFGSYHF